MNEFEKYSKKGFYHELVSYVDDQCLHCGGLGHCLENLCFRIWSDPIEDCKSGRATPKFELLHKQRNIKGDKLNV